MHRRVYRRVSRHVYRQDKHIDMCVDTCTTDMCIDKHTGMPIDVHRDKCKDVREGLCIGMYDYGA